MIVDINEIDGAAAVDAIAALEAELFGRGAWNANMVREELDAPARTYVLDVDSPSCRPDGEAAALSCRPERVDSSSCRPERPDSPSCRPERSPKGEVEGPRAGIAPDAIRGYAGFWYDGEDAEIMTIGVAKAHQRQGIAAGLLAALIDRAREQGARRMLLEVRVDNEPALALYRRFGFTRMGLRKRYYQPEGIDAYTMSLDLVPRTVGFAVPGAGADGAQRASESSENAHAGTARVDTAQAAAPAGTARAAVVAQADDAAQIDTAQIDTAQTTAAHADTAQADARQTDTHTQQTNGKA